MGHEIDQLMRLTHDISDALDQDDLDGCAALLAQRGNLLQSLTEKYGADGGTAMPGDLRETLAAVKVLDGILEDRLNGAMTRIGRQIGELKEKTRHGYGGNSPICLNRHA